jgi:hypothetical protein
VLVPLQSFRLKYDLPLEVGRVNLPRCDMVALGELGLPKCDVRRVPVVHIGKRWSTVAPHSGTAL